MFKKIALAAVALSVSSAGLALPFQTTDSFVHEKSGYAVKVRDTGNKMYLKGKNPATGETFDLVVSRSGKVKGTFAGRPVEYVMGTTDQTQLAVAHKALNGAQ